MKGAAPESRLSQMVEEGTQPDLPPNPLPDLIGFLMTAGPLLHTGTGPVPLTAVELMAWQQGSATHLTPWEFRQVLALSVDYLGELQRASDPDCPPPWQTTATPARRADVSKRIRSLLRS